MKSKIKFANTFGCCVTWDFKWEKEVLILLPFIVIILKFGKC